jgi:[acyl-carrier-protein] S-malonyltransferase
MELDGEHLEARERLVVTPAAGVFEPVDPLPHHVEVGSTLGFVHSTTAVTPVRSRFRGTVVTLVAAAGERLAEHERVAWLRLA